MPSRCRDSDAEIYGMGIIEFLYRYFTKEIDCKAFPDDLIDGLVKYNSAKL